MTTRAIYTLGPENQTGDIARILAFYPKNVWRKVARMMQKYWRIRDGLYKASAEDRKKLARNYLTQALKDTKLPYSVGFTIYLFNLRNFK